MDSAEQVEFEILKVSAVSHENGGRCSYFNLSDETSASIRLYSCCLIVSAMIRYRVFFEIELHFSVVRSLADIF